jgi:hypothetical protein
MLVIVEKQEPPALLSTSFLVSLFHIILDIKRCATKVLDIHPFLQKVMFIFQCPKIFQTFKRSATCYL